MWFSVQRNSIIDTDHKPIRWFAVSWPNHAKRFKNKTLKSNCPAVRTLSFAQQISELHAIFIMFQYTRSVHRHLFRWLIVYASFESVANVCLHSIDTMNHMEHVQLISTLILCNGARHNSTFTFVYVIRKLFISQQNNKLAHYLQASLNFVTITSSRFQWSRIYVADKVDGRHIRCTIWVNGSSVVHQWY